MAVVVTAADAVSACEEITCNILSFANSEATFEND